MPQACHQGSWRARACTQGWRLQLSCWPVFCLSACRALEAAAGFGESTPLSKLALQKGLVTSVESAGSPVGCLAKFSFDLITLSFFKWLPVPLQFQLVTVFLICYSKIVGSWQRPSCINSAGVQKRRHRGAGAASWRGVPSGRLYVPVLCGLGAAPEAAELCAHTARGGHGSSVPSGL